MIFLRVAELTNEGKLHIIEPGMEEYIADAREINNNKVFWCAEMVQNEMLKFQMKHQRTPDYHDEVSF